MNPWSIIESLENDNSRLAKEAILLQEATNNNIEFFEGCKAALDSMVTYGVKQIPEKVGDGPGLMDSFFWSVANQLATRKLSGNAARDSISALAEVATEQQWNKWYRRILIKDLRCGTSEKTINNALGTNFPEFLIPVFRAQLAHDGKDRPEKLTGKKIVQTKLDGVRCLTIVYPNSEVFQCSRNGKEFVNFEHIKIQLSAIASSIAPVEPMVLDGEVMSSSFQDLMKQARRKSDVAASDAVLHLFDIIPLREFNANTGSIDQLSRLAQLKTWYDANFENLPSVNVLDWEIVNLDTGEGMLRYSEINKAALDGGYEGLLLKDPIACYERKRVWSWIKVKPFITVDIAITGFEEGKGANAGKLGALLCEGFDRNVKIKTRVGGGFSDQLRAEIWASYTGVPVSYTKIDPFTKKRKTFVAEPGESVLNQIIEAKGDCLTKNQDSVDTWAIRFPSFLRFRGFAAGEKL